MVTAKAFREHQKKRPLAGPSNPRVGELFEPPDHPPPIAIPHVEAVQSQDEEDPSLIAARLELQSCRYETLSLWSSFRRPQRLEFASHPKIRLTRSTYFYRSIFNEPPYHLIQSPTNSLFLDTERNLHNLAQSLARLRASTEWEHNFQLQIRAAEKEVISFLNEMFSWKIDLFHEAQASVSTLNLPLVVETTRYLPFFREGDPLYTKFVLSGLLLALTVHLVFNGSQALCEVVLALLHDQIDILEGVIGETRRIQLSKSIPTTIKGVLSLFDLDPVVSRYLVCPQCYDITPFKAPSDSKDGNPSKHGSNSEADGRPKADTNTKAGGSSTAEGNPKICRHKNTPASPECGAKLVRTRVLNGKEVERPIKEYVHQSFIEWLARFLCRPEIEELLRRQKEEYRRRRAQASQQGHSGIEFATTSDILDSRAIQSFEWPDGKSFYDCADDEYRLFFSFTIDGFNANMNREAKATTTSTAIYLFCLNLPLEERHKPHNIYLAGVIPGPDKPSTSQINKYVDLVVDEFLPLYETGVRYTQTNHCSQGALARAAAMPVVCDSLGARQACGYGAVTSKFFCTVCWLQLHSLENFDKSSWPLRDLESHRHWANAWRDAEDEETQLKIFEAHGIRYTPLLRLPYFNPIIFTIIDTMHNFFLGLLQRHCRFIWGMDIDIADGDGTLRSRKNRPIEPSVGKMRAARKALEFGDVLQLAKTNKHVLFYLCLEQDIRRGGKKRDLVRELLRWRKRLGAFLPEGWGSTESDADTEQDAPVTTIYTMPAPPLIYAQQGMALPPISLPAGVSAERIETAETALSKGLKLDGITKDVLWYMCLRRNLPLPQNPQKKDMISALFEWKGEGQPPAKKEKHKMTVVLGRVVLTAVSTDMRRVTLPRWVDPAPIRAGQKKQGKLSADQWRSFCSIHLIITLIRLWGREPEESRWYQMLSNFLDLVTAVELGSMVVTSPEHRQAYETVIARYLVRMKELYKEAVIVPNHHLALHIPEFQENWGPSPQSRGFGWERNNHTLQQIKTNKRFGDMEKSYMFTSTRSSNLLALLSLENIRSVVSKMYTKIQKVINPDSRGTRVHDVLGKPSSDGNKRKDGKPVVLEPNVVDKLEALLALEGPDGVRVHPSATELPSIKQGGTVYRPYKRSAGDSNVLLPSETALGYQPARIQKIFSHQRVLGEEIVTETFLLVACLKPLPNDTAQQDWFRKFGRIAGSLWSAQYEEGERIVRASSVICHFALTTFGPSDTGFGFPTHHVLPLDRLKTHIESVGEAVKDSSFEDIFGGIGEDEEEEESDDGDSDYGMDVDTM